MKFQKIVYQGFVQVELWETDAPFPSEVVRVSDSVAGLLYDKVNDRVLLVHQERPAMVRAEDNPDGITTEMVAGRFDVNLGPKALLIKEAMEEAGVTLLEGDIELVNQGMPMSLSSGVLTERCYGAFAIIHPDKVSPGEQYGVAEEGEKTTRLWMSAEEFIHAQHECWRVWAFAQFLARRRLETQLAFRQ